MDVLVRRYLEGEEVLQPIEKKITPHRKEYTVPDFDSVGWARASDDLRHPSGCIAEELWTRTGVFYLYPVLKYRPE